MRAKPFRRTPVPDLNGKGPAARIPRAAAVALVASRVPRREFDDLSVIHNRVSSSISYAVKTGKLKPVKAGFVKVGELVQWARQKWPGRFDDLPTATMRMQDFAVQKIRVASGSHDVVLPGDIHRCHEAIRAMAARILKLEQELVSAQSVASAAKFKAARWDDWNRRKGRQHTAKP